MKNLLLVFLILGTTFSGLAQVESGSKFINGTVNLLLFGGDNSDGVNSQITLSPRFGYLISDQIAVGGSIGLTIQSFGGESDATVSLSPFIRRYFSIVDDKFYFFLNGSLTLAYGGFVIEDVAVTTDDSFSISLNALPGFSYFPSERWSLDFSLSGLSLSFLGIGGENSVNTFLLGATTASPSLGFSYFFCVNPGSV